MKKCRDRVAVLLKYEVCSFIDFLNIFPTAISVIISPQWRMSVEISCHYCISIDSILQVFNCTGSSGWAVNVINSEFSIVLPYGDLLDMCWFLRCNKILNIRCGVISDVGYDSSTICSTITLVCSISGDVWVYCSMLRLLDECYMYFPIAEDLCKLLLLSAFYTHSVYVELQNVE